MAQRKYFSHVSPVGEQLGDRIRAAGYGKPGDGWRAGEDLGWGTGERATPHALVDAWLAAPATGGSCCPPTTASSASAWPPARPSRTRPGRPAPPTMDVGVPPG